MDNVLTPNSEPTLACIISLVCPSNTMGGLRAMLATADRLAATDELELLDGWHILASATDAAATAAPLTARPNLGDVRAFAAANADLADAAPLEYATDLCIDLPVFTLAPISCGEHVGGSPDNVLVVVNPECRDDG